MKSCLVFVFFLLNAKSKKNYCNLNFNFFKLYEIIFLVEINTNRIKLQSNLIIVQIFLQNFLIYSKLFSTALKKSLCVQ
jgi:hypothetical protein